MTTIHPLRRLDRVYCAGPLFNSAERSEMERIAQSLAQYGFKTFVPHADGMEFTKVNSVLTEWGHDPVAVGRLLQEAIFALDTYQVVLGCGALVFNMNGRVPDEGAVVEATMAWMLDKPVVVYKEDVRSLIAGRDNPLLVGHVAFEPIDRMDRLGPALAAQVASGDFDPGVGATCPRHLQKPLERGEQLWRRLESQGEGTDDRAVAQVVLELFGESWLGSLSPGSSVSRP